MRTKKILMILALLCIIVQGAWAQNYKVWDGSTTTKPLFYSSYAGYTNVVVINTGAELAYVRDNWTSNSGYSDNKPYYQLRYLLTADLNNTESSFQGVAPFRQINGATIKDLTVAGTITSNAYHTSGLVGFADGTNLNEGCAATATINQNNNYVGGIVGHGQNSNTTIRGCAFAGTINGVGGNRSNIGGIWGWSDSGTPTLENSLEAGTYTNIASMHPMGLQKAAGTITNCYYVTPQIGTPRNACTVSGSTQVLAAVPDNEISKKITIAGITVYNTSSCTVSGVETSYDLYANPVGITPVVTDPSGASLAFGTGYTATLDGATVESLPISITTEGSHTLVLTGTGDYQGAKTLAIDATVNGNEATVRGYVMRGTDNVSSQGFIYWPVSNGGNGNAAPTVPQDAMRVEATGTVMQASLTGLSYETDYCYMAYVTTAEGETFYGEQQQFRTGTDTSGVTAPRATAQATVVAYYDLRGRRYATPQPGLNIVLMSDGTTHKVVKR